MQFSTKKIGVIFFFEQMPNRGGSLAKDHTFSGFSFVQPSLIAIISAPSQGSLVPWWESSEVDGGVVRYLGAWGVIILWFSLFHPARAMCAVGSLLYCHMQFFADREAVWTMLVLLYTSLSCHQVVDRSLFRWLWDIVTLLKRYCWENTPYILYLQTLFCLRFPGFSLSANIVSMVIYCTTLNIVDGDCLP